MTVRWRTRDLFSRACLIGVTSWWCLASPIAAGTTLVQLDGSPDVPVEVFGLVARDADVVQSLQIAAAPLLLPGTTPSSSLTAYARLPDGDALVVFGSSQLLPGPSGAIVARSNDVLRLSSSTYVHELEGDAVGLPRRARIDAVARVSTGLLLSFDVSVELGGVLARDEDLVIVDDFGAFALYFDGSAAGIPYQADLDGAHVVEPNGNLLLSFDHSIGLDGLHVADEDVAERELATSSWVRVHDGSAASAGWRGADLDAVWALTDSDDDGLSDPDEVLAGTDPLDSDSDDDGLLDGVEDGGGVFVDAGMTGTDPLNPDSDGDGVDDGVEVLAGSDPNDPGSQPPRVPGPGAWSALLAALVILGAARRSAAWSPRPRPRTPRSSTRRSP